MTVRYGEAKNSQKGTTGPKFYEEDLRAVEEERTRDAASPKIIKANEMVWEDSPQGHIKHIARTEMNPHDKDVDAYIQEIAPGKKSGKHRHMAEEMMFILEGQGYSLHWDVDTVISDRMGWDVSQEAQRFDWEAGDWVFVPVNTVHQHFNSGKKDVVRFLSASSRLFKWLGLNDLEQIETADE